MAGKVAFSREVFVSLHHGGARYLQLTGQLAAGRELFARLELAIEDGLADVLVEPQVFGLPAVAPFEGAESER